MTFRVSRRNFVAGGATLLSLSALGTSALAQEKRLRLLWWGSQPRADRTNKVSQLYQTKNPGTSITGEFLGWGDYWPRLATQVAGRNAPDVIQMDYRYIVQYARRGALAPLESYMPAKLNLDDFDKAQIEGGSVDGHLYGVSLGANSAATVLNTTAFKEAGVDLPTQATTWEEFARMRLQDRTDHLSRRARAVADQRRIKPVLSAQIVGDIGRSQACYLDAPVAACGCERTIRKRREMRAEKGARPEMQDAAFQLVAVIGGKLRCRGEAGKGLQSFGHSL